MNLQTIYISSLLHDIGKFIERTKKYTEFSFTPSEREIRYSHPRYGAKWFEVVSKSIPLFKDMPSKELKEIKEIILTHHQPRDIYGKIVQLADWLSSSEREEEEEKSDISYNKQALRSIFSSINDYDANLYYNAKPLDFESMFPKEIKTVDLNKLEEEFEKSLVSITDEDELLSLLEIYTWAIPAQTGKYTPDVSLYDHLSTTAAFAVSLWYEVENGNLSESTLNKIIREPAERKGVYFYLLGGDLSGIQNFIFDIPSRNAAKSLKGRSLFLSLLTEVASEFIVRELGLKASNILYRGGGNFQILIPVSFEHKLEDIRKRVSTILFEALGNKIYIALDWIPIDIEDIFAKSISSIYRKLGEKLSEKKMKKYEEILDIDILFSPPKGLFSYEEHCHICGENRKEFLYDREICKMCHSFIELAEEVKGAKYLLKRYKKPYDKKIFTYRDIFESFGIEGFFSKTKKPDYRTYDLYNFSPYGFRLGAYKTPNKSFEEMLQDKEKTKYLTYLKLDVDNLGELFRSGLSKSQSISRRATLSRMLRLFFGAHIPYKYQNREDIYLLYSGGDDTFIIGVWDKIFDVASEIREDFKRFVGGNPSLSFSSGMSIFHHHFPIKRAADIVEDELSIAKNNSGKDSIAIFSEPFKWGEFRDILHLSDEFVEWAKQERKRAFIHKVQMLSKDFSTIREDFHNIGKPWEFLYALRNIGKEKVCKIVEIVKAIWLWEGEVDIEKFGYHITNPAFLNISARIAELKLREVVFNE